MVRTAYRLHAEDDDWGQAGTMVREVLDDAARERLVSNVVGHLLNGVTEPVLQRAFEYWRNVDKNLGDKIEADVRAKQDREGPQGRRAGEPGPFEHAGQGLTRPRDGAPLTSNPRGIPESGARFSALTRIMSACRRGEPPVTVTVRVGLQGWGLLNKQTPS